MTWINPGSMFLLWLAALAPILDLPFRGFHWLVATLYSCMGLGLKRGPMAGNVRVKLSRPVISGLRM